MSGADELADSTDWLTTPLSGLAPLESALRCQVCKDFFTTPMITSCSHTFCSLCIRRYLSQEGRCPACRESDQEMKLRRNWAVEEMVSHFTQARSGILEFARKPPVQLETNGSERPKKRRKIEAPKDLVERRSTRSQSKRLTNAASQASQDEVVSTQEEIPNSEDEGSDFEPDVQRGSRRDNGEPHDGLVACPCCHRRMKETSINAHLDRCIQGLATSPSPPVLQATTNGHSTTTTLSYAQRTKSPLVVPKKDRLPTINYSMYTETSLRKKLKELGIPAQGNKELMRRRHTEWMNLWNANCDSLQPRTKQALLKELDVWERTLGRQLERGVTSATSGVMVKDFDRDGWAKSQKGEFDDLIKRAREHRKAQSMAKVREQDAARSDDIQMTSGNIDADTGLEDSSMTNQATDSTSEVGSNSVPVGLDTNIHAPAPMNDDPEEQVRDHIAANTTTTDVTYTLDTDMTPGTPQKPASSHEQIDLTDSPAGALSQGSPAKQRSKFFA